MTELEETLKRGGDKSGFPSVSGIGAHLAHDITTWFGCAITLLLTYLAQRVR